MGDLRVEAVMPQGGRIEAEREHLFARKRGKEVKRESRVVSLRDPLNVRGGFHGVAGVECVLEPLVQIGVPESSTASDERRPH